MSVRGQGPAGSATAAEPRAAAATLTEPERRLKRLLHAGAVLFLVLTLALFVVPALGSFGSALRRPPWIPGAALEGALLTMLFAYAAGDPRRRGGLIGVIATVLLVSTLVEIAYLLGGGPLGLLETTPEHLLIAGASASVAVAAAVLVRASAARRARLEAGPPAPSSHWRSDASGGLRLVLPALGLVCAALAGAIALGPFLDPLEGLFSQPFLSAQAAGGAAGLAALAFYVAGGIRGGLTLVSGIAVALAFGILATLRSWGHVHAGGDIRVAGASLEPSPALLAVIGVAAALAAALLVLQRVGYRARLDLKFLWPSQYRALVALADVIVYGPEEAVPPADIAANVDRYFVNIRARRRWVQPAVLVGMQLHPLLYLKPPFSELDEEGRLHHLKTHFYRAVSLKLVPGAVRQLVQAMIRVANQLAYVGYYNDPRSFSAIGYERFTERERYPELERVGAIAKPGRHPLTVERPADVEELGADADVCIVGSGAAGAVLAHELAERGNDVVMLERGQYVEPRDFNDDEVEMIGKLYADGAFQQSEDFRFTVLQGSCVGGTTVVNNAVSFRPPPDAVERWNREFHAGIDAARLTASTDHVERWLSIRPQDEGGSNPHIKLNPSYPKFLDGVRKRSADPDFQLEVGTVRANITGCVGAGYCNIGCRYGKKLSMLDTVLPWTQRKFPDRLRIYADCEVDRIETGGDGTRRATAVRARLRDGRTMKVRARTFVVSAGVVASSYLLMRSGIGKGLPVGRRLSFNMGAPLTAEFDDDLAAYDGLQISHYGIPRRDRGWVMETWWNPPVSQALNMPGWFETHYENMRRYRHLMAVGVLVGTESNARIGRALTGGPGIHYVPTPSDMRKLADGLMELGRILFAGGAKSVMVNAWDFYRFTSPNGLNELPAIMSDPSKVTLGTGHPQGGNAIGGDPSLGVVDPDFRVYGYSNLFVCDASVFPTSITVNPQLTVMSLAHYAAPAIASAPGRAGAS